MTGFACQAGTFGVLSPQHNQRDTPEQVCKSIARYLALSIPLDIGAEVPVPGVTQGSVGQEVYKSIMIFSQEFGCEVMELNVQADHVHLLVKVLLRVLISTLMGVLKGRAAIRVFRQISFLKRRH